MSAMTLPPPSPREFDPGGLAKPGRPSWGLSASEAGMRLKLAFGGGCRHQQAEPVILTTGETVACVCIACLEPLPADWIEDQYDSAYREATCTHDDEERLVRFGQVGETLLCTRCGRRRET